MKKYSLLTQVLVLLLMVPRANAQEGPKAFHKYCVVASVTGGPSKAIYTTKDYKGNQIYSEILNGYIDPFITEYGLTDKIGIGSTRGGDNFDVDVNKFYKQHLSTSDNKNMMSTQTHYITGDLSYHYFVTKRIDLSAFGSVGYFTVSGNAGYQGEGVYFKDPLYTYSGQGAVVRTGLRARWYFTKRFGIMNMVYCYKGFAKEPHYENSVSDASTLMNQGITTTLSGVGCEIGLCFRIGKQKVKQDQTLATRKIKEAKQRKIKDDDGDNKIPLFEWKWN